MSAALFLFGLFLAGSVLSEWLWSWEERDYGDQGRAGPVERWCSAGLLGVALWIAVNWLWSYPGLLSRNSLNLTTGGLLLGSLAVLKLRTRRGLLALPGALPLLLLTPALLWALFVAWRGTVVTVQNADANSYHMPKAALLMEAGGYRYLTLDDPRISGFPCNYEFLLADMMLLDGQDRLTIWISLLSYGLCLVATAALMERWWAPGWPGLLAALFLAGTPVTLLSSGHQKNDLLAGFFFLCAFLWTARWCARGGRASLVLALLAQEAALGTKPYALFLTASCGAWLLATALRPSRRSHWTARSLLAGGLLAVLGLGLMGVQVYLINLWHTGHPLAITGLVSQTQCTVGAQGYGDWFHLYLYPILLLMVPFNQEHVWVPWRQETWLWPHNQVFNSHYSWIFTVLVAALPLGLALAGRLPLQDPEQGSERKMGSWMILVCFVLTLPIRCRPIGMFCSFVRYTIWIVPLVLAWTLAPAGCWLQQRRRFYSLGAAGVLLSLLLARQAWFAALKDEYCPLDFVWWCSSHPGQRVTAFPLRAASLVDQLAGPQDTIAIDLGPADTWSYPAWGRDFRRKVIFLPGGPGPVIIPPEADWVVIDRIWNIIWGHPQFTHTADFHKYMFQGQPAAEDLRVYLALKDDPRFELVKEGPSPLNFVFRRKGP